MIGLGALLSSQSRIKAERLIPYMHVWERNHPLFKTGNSLSS